MDAPPIEDRELSLDAQNRKLLVLVELQGKHIVHDATTYGALFERQQPPLLALLETPGTHKFVPLAGSKYLMVPRK
jgi:hypothetical protein